MNTRYILVLTLITSVTVLGGWFFLSPTFRAAQPPVPPGDDNTVVATFTTDTHTTQPVTLELATTPPERQQGLMHRKSLPRRHGMLFVFSHADTRMFWMRNTYIPLDIIFIAPNRTVLNVAHASPEPNATPDNATKYWSAGPAKYVIELPRGYANRTGITTGATVHFHSSAPNTTTATPRDT